MKSPETEASFEEWAVATVRNLWVCVAILSTFLVVTMGLAVYGVSNGDSTLGRVRHDEQATSASAYQACLVQKYGLQAERYLRGSLHQIDLLLSLPPTEASKKQQKLVPPVELKTELRIVKTLKTDLFDYVWLIKKGPPARSCK